ncbi:hypothetical protein PQX77_018327 [Marasmius sp. AFHP31]|nr:hypothetical protein PQX77_018327 [Marasmius sp. AFHP31]
MSASLLAARFAPKKKPGDQEGSKISNDQTADNPTPCPSKAAMKNSVWFEAAGKKRPKPLVLTSQTTTGGQQAKAKKTNKKIPAPTKKRAPTPIASEDENEDRNERSDIDNLPSEDEGGGNGNNESQDEDIQPSKRQVVPLDPGFEEPDSYVLPNAHSRTSSISLPAASDDFTWDGFVVDDHDGQSDDGAVLDKPPPTRSKRGRTASSDGKDNSQDQLLAKKTRAEKFLAERPTIVPTTTNSARSAGTNPPTVGSTKNPAPARNATDTWPSDTDYVPPGSGNRLISKSAQVEPFTSILEKGTSNAIALFLFDCAYPTKPMQAKLLLDALVMAATEMNAPVIVKRLQHPNQKKYRKCLAEYIFNHVVHMRGHVRDAAKSIVVASYPLTGWAADNIWALTSFLRARRHYVYPHDIPPPPSSSEVKTTRAPVTPVLVEAVTPVDQVPESNDAVSQDEASGKSTESEPTNLQETAAAVNSPQVSAVPDKAADTIDYPMLVKSRPYQHPAIVAVLRTLFVGSSSPGVTFQQLFRSSLAGSDDPEIPMAMLAMVAAIVHFSLQEYSEGRFVLKKFESSAVQGEYEENIAILGKIAEHPRKYHCMMADLYRLATSEESAKKPEDNDDSELDIGVMEE